MIFDRINSNSDSMAQSPSNTICLAILIKPNTTLSDTALLSAKPFIDHWVICSQGLQEQDQLFVRNTLAGIDGHFMSGPMNHYGDAKTALLAQAQTHADWVLLLDLNEELCVLEPVLSLPANADVGVLDIAKKNVVVSEARLFRSTAKVFFNYPAAEQAVLGGLEVDFASSFSISSHADQPDWVGDIVANRFLLDAVLGEFEVDANLLMALGLIELSSGQLDLALTHFEGIYMLAAAEPVLWMAHYLAGNICLAKQQHQGAIEHWQAAFELTPTRAEPLFRLAKMHFDESDFRTAGLLAEQAGSIDKPVEVSYHEPSIYTHTAALLKAQSWHRQGRSEEAIDAVQHLLKQSLSHVIKSQVRATLVEIESADSEKANPTKPPVSSVLTVPCVSNSPRPKLTVGMATHDDYDGVYFSVMSLVLYHQQCLHDIEILIIDNNPSSKHGEAVRGLAERVPNVRYVAAKEYRGTAIRERVFHEANGKYVLCMDCHVFLHAGALRRLIDYFDANSESADILHGPIYYDNHDNFSTHMTPEWREGFYGRWGKDDRGGEIESEPFDIPMQGLGLFACVKGNWPSFNLKFRGFGGEEGYIHEKFRQHGGRVLCLPFLRWTHRFDRPNAPTYPNSWEDRIRNYHIGWEELGLDTRPILNHFSDLLGEANTSSMYSRLLLEKASPLWQYDSIYLFTQKSMPPPSLNGLGVQRIMQTTTSMSELRSLFRRASEQQRPNVLLIVALTESDAEFESAICNAISNFSDLNSRSRDVELIESPVFQVALLAPTLYDFVVDSFTEHSGLDIKKLDELSLAARSTAGNSL